MLFVWKPCIDVVHVGCGLSDPGSVSSAAALCCPLFCTAAVENSISGSIIGQICFDQCALGVKHYNIKEKNEYKEMNTQYKADLLQETDCLLSHA